LRGRAVTHGAISIVNAISIGTGSALGINLKTEAEVSFDYSRGKGRITTLGDFSEDALLSKETVNEIMRLYGNNEFEITITTKSEIPPGKGLKSSSAAANALALASFHALNLKIEDLNIINAGINASLKSGVTITGALDDSCASYYGGFVVCDNIHRKLIRREKVSEDLRVVIYIPEETMYTKDFDIKKIASSKKQVSEAYELVIKRNYWEAMTLNGRIHSSALGFDLTLAEEALDSGALGAGLSGTGPAVAAVCEKSVVNEIKNKWNSKKGIVLDKSVNNVKANGKRLNEGKS
jgi:shikimate kinase